MKKTLQGRQISLAAGLVSLYDIKATEQRLVRGPSEGSIMTCIPRLPACRRWKRFSISACRPLPVPILPVAGVPHCSSILPFPAPSLATKFCKTKPIRDTANPGQVIESKEVMATPAPIDAWKTNPIPGGGGKSGTAAGRQVDRHQAGVRQEGGSGFGCHGQTRLSVLVRVHSVASQDTLKLRLGVPPLTPSPFSPQSCRTPHRAKAEVFPLFILRRRLHWGFSHRFYAFLWFGVDKS